MRKKARCTGDAAGSPACLTIQLLDCAFRWHSSCRYAFEQRLRKSRLHGQHKVGNCHPHCTIDCCADRVQRVRCNAFEREKPITRLTRELISHRVSASRANALTSGQASGAPMESNSLDAVGPHLIGPHHNRCLRCVSSCSRAGEQIESFQGVSRQSQLAKLRHVLPNGDRFLRGSI